MKSSRSIPLLAVALCAVLASCGSDQVPYDGSMDPVAILVFSPDPAEIRLGETSTLQWATRDALFVQLEDETGAVLGGDDLGIGTGTFEIAPERTTRYTLTAFGASGAQRFAHVKVVVDAHAPEVTFTGAEDRIHVGESTRLEWKVTGATGVRLLAGDATLLEDAGDEGSLEVSPERTTTYVLETTGSGGSKSQAEVKVKVAPVINSFRASPSGPQLEGVKVSLVWKTTGADSVRLKGKDLDYTAPAERIKSGAWQVNAGVGTVVLVASREGVEEEKEIKVPLLVAPVIDLFEVTPGEVAASPERPGSVMLKWKVTGAETISLHRSGEEEPQSLEQEGERTLEIEETTTFSLVAVNPAGEATMESKVNVFPPAIISGFEASPDHLDAAGTVRISWSTTDALFVDLLKDDVAVGPDELGPSGSIDVHVDKTTVFRLIATDEAGGDSETKSLTVTVGAPAPE